MKKKLWIISLLIFALVLGTQIKPAYGADTMHPVTIEWYYGRGTGSLVNGVAGTKLGSTSLQVPNGTFDFTDYCNNPDGANFYMMYGITPIIRINGDYYLLASKYIESNSNYDDLNNTIEVSDQDTEINIKLYYTKIKFIEPSNLDKIKISVDGSANENLTSENHYEAYQIFHVTKSDDVQEDVTTDETVGKTISGEDAEGFSYYIKESDEWYPVVSQMTNWFKLEQTTEEGTYVVSLADGVSAEEATAIAIADYLEQYTNGKTAIDITSGQARLDIDPGYYLIVSPINSNLILATTNIDITEKAFYPSIDKTVAEEDKNSAVGSMVHFTSKVSIPKGSKAEMIITDSMTEGLTFDPDSLEVTPTVNYQFETTDDGFKITIAANDIKTLAAEGKVDLILTYEAELNKKAIVAARDDTTILGNVNEITLKYVNYIQSAMVDVDTTQFTLLKYDSKDDTKTPIAGAKFNLLDDKGNLIKLYEIKPNEEYRLATSTDSSFMTEIETVDNKQIKIWGLDADITYKLKEIEAPAGYNALSNIIDVNPSEDLSLVVEVPNSTGSILPSTGGIGTIIFYVVGSAMVISGLAWFWIKQH